jgi:hypothetical protein
MGKIAKEPITNILEREYASIEEVVQFLNVAVEGIQSQLNFTRYIKVLKAQMCNACTETKSALLPVIEKYNKVIEEGKIKADELQENSHFKTIVNLVVPSMLFENQLSFIAAPFKKEMVVKTPTLANVVSDNEWKIKLDPDKLLSYKNFATRDASIFILNKFYNQNLSFNTNEILTLTHVDKGIEKHFQTIMNFDFVDVNVTGELPQLSQLEINHLIHHYDDDDLWTKLLPLNQFTFSGFTIGTLNDITQIEVLTQLKHWISQENSYLDENNFLETLSKYLKSYLQLEDLVCGNMILDFEEIQENAKYSLTGKTNISDLDYIKNPEDKGGIFYKIMVKKNPEYIADLHQIEEKSRGEQILEKKGYRSIILHPVALNKKEVSGIFGIASKEPNVFNAMTIIRLSEIFSIIETGYDYFLKSIQNSVSNIIQQNFTSIHPSVEWKFQKVALAYHISESKGIDKSIDPIIFQNVHPLYAQSDIVSSSTIRNSLIKEDLQENLTMLLEVIKKWLRKDTLFVLDAYKAKIESTLNKINDNFVAIDETSIVNFLASEIHPMLAGLYERYTDLHPGIYKKYLNHLDPKLGIVYTKRRSFENSVVKIRTSVSKFLDREEKKLQKYLPHYFEKYKTDGVEYNMYVGQSLLKDRQFQNYDLQNFRLWQLVNTCEITRLVKKLQPELEIGLETAELIFVYGHSLSIRFRLDEKKFDVDGSYNVRYEILKKRIDKAVIKGTNERITVAGKVAIVYLDNNDKHEYIDYINYLIDKGYVEEKYEDLELEKMQGAEGLKALRVTVI